MKVGKYFLSSLGGRFSTTSVVKVEGKLLLDSGIQQKKVGLAEIHHFAKCTLMVMQEDSTSKPCAIWLYSSCEFFDEHQCQVWFDSPTELKFKWHYLHFTYFDS